MSYILESDFLKTYDTLSECYLTESTNSDRISQYYANTDIVPFYYNVDGYGYPWEELADCSRSVTAPFYNISGIYLVVNKDTHQAYVGKAANVARRMDAHRYANNQTDSPFLHTAVRHFHPEKFKYTLIEVMPEEIFGDDEAELNWFIEEEQKWIKNLHTYTDPWNYNLDIGGGNTPILIIHLNDKIKDIQKELDEHPEIPFSKLAKMFKISNRSIVDINRGIGRYGKIKYRDDLTFPIINTNPDNLDTTKQGWNLNSVETKWKRRLEHKPWYFARAYYDDTNNLNIERFVNVEKVFGSNTRKAIEGWFKRHDVQPIDLPFNEILSYVEQHKDELYKHKDTNSYWFKVKLSPEDKAWYTGKED